MALYDENGTLIPEVSDNQPVGSGSWFVKLYNRMWSQLHVRFKDDRQNIWSLMLELVKGTHTVKELQTRVVQVPTGWGGTDDNLENKEELGRLMGEDLVEVSEAFRPIIYANGVTDDEVTRWIEEAAADFKDLRIKAYIRFSLLHRNYPVDSRCSNTHCSLTQTNRFGLVVLFHLSPLQCELQGPLIVWYNTTSPYTCATYRSSIP